MFIQTEQTPNPLTLKFIPGDSVLGQSTADFASVEAAERSPLAQRLFRIQGVSRVFLGHDFISVTRSDDYPWDVMKPLILAGIMEHYASGQPLLRDVTSAAASSKSAADVGDLEAEIIDIIEQRVRPAVAQDGGDIVFDRFENGVVYLELRGACAGCPSSTATLKAGIENMLRHYVPEVERVEAVQ